MTLSRPYSTSMDSLGSKSILGLLILVAKHKGRFWIYVSVLGFTWQRNVPEHMTTVIIIASLS